MSKRKVQNYLRIHRPRVASQLSECGGAGTGCGWCVPFLKKLHRQSREEALGDDAELPSAEEYAAGRGRYVRAGKGTPPPGATPISK